MSVFLCLVCIILLVVLSGYCLKHALQEGNSILGRLLFIGCGLFFGMAFAWFFGLVLI